MPLLLLEQLQRRRKNDFLPLGVFPSRGMQTVRGNKRRIVLHFFAQLENTDDAQFALLRFLYNDLVEAQNSLRNVAPMSVTASSRRHTKIGNRNDEQSV